jgi:hypothetical protein
MKRLQMVISRLDLGSRLMVSRGRANFRPRIGKPSRKMAPLIRQFSPCTNRQFSGGSIVAQPAGEMESGKTLETDSRKPHLYSFSFSPTKRRCELCLGGKAIKSGGRSQGLSRSRLLGHCGFLTASAEPLSKIKAAQRTSYIEPPVLDTEAVKGPFSLGVLRQD